MTQFTVRQEAWSFDRPFGISRGTRNNCEVVVVELCRGQAIGRGECVPYPRYGESVSGVIGQLEALAVVVRDGVDRDTVQKLLPPGAARNALDCALWDLEAKETGTPAWRLAGLEQPQPLTTAFTIGLESLSSMSEAARRNSHRPLLKIKLDGAGDLERVAAIRQQAPNTSLIVDANEGWSNSQVEPMAESLAKLGVAMVEQPLPAGEDSLLSSVPHPIPFCADESCHTTDDLKLITDRYDMVNIKLDKTGGLSEGLRLRRRALTLGIDFMVGCMVGTSLSMAPACLLAQKAHFVDLDGPLLLANDRKSGLCYDNSTICPPTGTLWG